MASLGNHWDDALKYQAMQQLGAYQQAAQQARQIYGLTAVDGIAAISGVHEIEIYNPVTASNNKLLLLMEDV